MKYDIIPIAEQHIQGFRDTLDFVAKERTYLASFEAPPIENITSFVQNNIKHGYPQFVVIADNRVVGWCDIIPITNAPLYAHAGVMGVGILPPFRGHGVGRALIETTIQAAKGYGLRRVELVVREDNKNAIELYKTLGFEMEGTKKKAVYMDGIYEDLHMMALLFA